MHNHIYRKLLPALIFIVLTWSFQSTAYAEKVRHTDTKKHFLWSVESKQNTIYLLGSIHILKKESYPLAEEIEGIYDCCNKLVFETDLDAANNPAFQKKMQMLARYADGQTLKGNISRETYSLFEQKMMKSGYPVSELYWSKPWYGALLLTVLEFNRLGYNTEYGIDPYYYRKAKRDKKEMIFLESNEYQINIFAGLNEQQQELFLRQVIKELEVIETMASDMVNAWITGNTDKLNSIIKMGFSEYPDIYDRFFTERNKRWVLKIRKLMEQKDNVLIIVGAGHLVGKDSVVDLLRKNGYKVTQR